MKRTPSRRALVLIVVMVVIAMLSLAGFTYGELMFGEHEAAVLHGKLDVRGKRVGIIVSGGNVDLGSFAGFLQGQPS